MPLQHGTKTRSDKPVDQPTAWAGTDTQLAGWSERNSGGAGCMCSRRWYETRAWVWRFPKPRGTVSRVQAATKGLGWTGHTGKPSCSTIETSSVTANLQKTRKSDRQREREGGTGPLSGRTLQRQKRTRHYTKPCERGASLQNSPQNAWCRYFQGNALPSSDHPVLCYREKLKRVAHHLTQVDPVKNHRGYDPRQDQECNRSVKQQYRGAPTSAIGGRGVRAAVKSAARQRREISAANQKDRRETAPAGLPRNKILERNDKTRRIKQDR